MQSESHWLVDRSQAVSTGGMVAAKTPQAAQAGVDVLRNGGNAVDAAVVTALVAGVVEPWMNGIGGGGYLIRHDSRSGATDVVAYPVIAPGSATPDMFPLTAAGTDSALFGWRSVVGAANIVGHRAVCVPGTVDGLSQALARWGTLSWSSALEPAIVWAEDGFRVTWHTTMEIARDLANLRKFPATQDILCPDGLVPWSISDADQSKLRQIDLAGTLKHLARHGSRSLYEGELAQRTVAHLNDGGAGFVEQDFRGYEAKFAEPLQLEYEGITVATLPGGTGGPTLAESLRIIERTGASRFGHNSPETLHRLAQAFAIAFADRFGFLADPGFVDVPLESLLSDSYIDDRARTIGGGPAMPPSAGSRDALGVSHQLAPSMAGYASGGSTTHLSVIDKDGVAVTLTQTLLSVWGSRVTVPGTGIILNNGMMWFDPEPGRPNSVAGGKSGLSNMAPALLIDDGQVVAALGASGGRRIMNCVAQIAMNLIDHQMSMQQAVSVPRIDRSTNQLFVSSRLPAETLTTLRELGHEVEPKDESLFFGEFASPACVRFDGNQFEGGVDPFYYPATASGG